MKVGHNPGSLKVLSAIALCRKYKELLETELGAGVDLTAIDWVRQHHSYTERKPRISEDNYITGWVRDPHANCMDEAKEVELENGKCGLLGKREQLFAQHIEESGCTCGVQHYRCGWCR